MDEPPPVVLAVDMSNRRSVKRVSRALWNVPGVSRFFASRRTGTVVVHGDTYMDARTLKRRLEQATERRVRILSDGGRPEREEVMPYAAYNYAPPPAPYPYPYPYPPPPPPPYYYQYQQRQYVGPSSSIFDDTIPGNACTIM